MIKNCICPFYDALEKRIVPSEDVRLVDPILSALYHDAKECCCLGFMLFLAFQCDDAGAFVAKMRDAIKDVYGPPDGWA